MLSSGFPGWRAEVMFHSNPGQKRLKSSPHLSTKRCHQHSQWVSLIPSLSSLVHIQLHNCSCYVCYIDLSSPVRAALMHTIAHHPQSDCLVLLGRNAPASSLTHAAVTAPLLSQEPLSRSFMTNCHQALK